jgi:PTS system nitrogen regulatory IIA component
MQLNVREAARLLHLSEKTVYRWVQQGKLPASKINDQYRFHRADLLEWATAHKISVSPELFRQPESEAAPSVALAAALRVGGIHSRVSGSDRVTALESVVRMLPLPEEVDRAFLLQLLLARESLGSTGLGGGIAVPHVRNPIVMHVPEPMITLCFLDKPIEFGAVDGQPVHTLFTIVSPTIRAHLSLLARLAFALRQPAFAETIAKKRSPEAIFRDAAAVDRAVAMTNPEAEEAG